MTAGAVSAGAGRDGGESIDESDARQALAAFQSRPDWYADATLVRRTVTTTRWEPQP